jgi:hypothetical protein
MALVCFGLQSYASLFGKVFENFAEHRTGIFDAVEATRFFKLPQGTVYTTLAKTFGALRPPWTIISVVSGFNDSLNQSFNRRGEFLTGLPANLEMLLWSGSAVEVRLPPAVGRTFELIRPQKRKLLCQESITYVAEANANVNRPFGFDW